MNSPPLRYHGSKFALAERIRNLSPQLPCADSRLPRVPDYTHRLIPFAGGLGELFGCYWPTEGISETVNDLSRRVSDFWQCLSDPHNAAAFLRKAAFTPFSQVVFDEREELYKSNYIADRALAFYVEQRMSRQGARNTFATPSTRTRRGMNEQVSAWLTAVEGLPDIVERMRRVEVRNMDAAAFIRQYDHELAFFYVDPPYVADTRQSVGQYHEDSFDREKQIELLETLAQIKGKFLLSGYHNPIYSVWAERHGFNVQAILVDKKSSADPHAIAYEHFWRNYT